MNCIQDMCGGKDYDVDFVICMCGIGVWVDLLYQCFEKVSWCLGIDYCNWVFVMLDVSCFKWLVVVLMGQGCLVGDVQLDLF